MGLPAYYGVEGCLDANAALYHPMLTSVERRSSTNTYKREWDEHFEWYVISE